MIHKYYFFLKTIALFTVSWYNFIGDNMQNLKIHFLNTIWSDAIVLESNGKYCMVDTGSSFYYPMIEKYLKDLGVEKLDFIILTHFHTDHYGNLKNIINDFKVEKVYLKHYHGLDGTTSSGYASNEEYIENEFKNYNNILEKAKEMNTEIVFVDDLDINVYEVLFENTTLELYDADNRLYKLYSDVDGKFYNQKLFNENFNSMGIFIKEKEKNIFLGGDVTCSSSEIEDVKALSYKMIQKIYEKHNINNIDIYKSCHHGGGGTNTLDLCKLIKAKFAVITNTARWLDTYSTYDNLKNGNSDVLILPTDHQKYIFEIDDEIKCEIIKEESLFLTLNKN